MKYLFAAAALASFVAAQDECLSAAVAIPACGLGCITPVAGDLGCELTDFACQCQTENVAAIQSSAQECVISACSGVETALQVQSAANAVCSCVSSAGGGSMTPSSSDAMSTGDMESSMDMGSMSIMTDMPTETGAAGSEETGGDDSSDAPSSSGAGGSSDSQSTVSPGAGNTVAVAGSISGIMGGLLALIAAL